MDRNKETKFSEGKRQREKQVADGGKGKDRLKLSDRGLVVDRATADPENKMGQGKTMREVLDKLSLWCLQNEQGRTKV